VLAKEFREANIFNYKKNGMLNAALIKKLLGKNCAAVYTAVQMWSVLISATCKLIVEHEQDDLGLSLKLLRVLDAEMQEKCFRVTVYEAQKSSRLISYPDAHVSKFAVAGSVSPVANVRMASANDLLNTGWKSDLTHYLDKEQILKDNFAVLLPDWPEFVRNKFAEAVFKTIKEGERFLSGYCLYAFYLDLSRDPLASRVVVTERFGCYSAKDSVTSDGLKKIFQEASPFLQVRLAVNDPVHCVRLFNDRDKNLFKILKTDLKKDYEKYRQVAIAFSSLESAQEIFDYCFELLKERFFTLSELFNFSEEMVNKSNGRDRVKWLEVSLLLSDAPCFDQGEQMRALEENFFKSMTKVEKGCIAGLACVTVAFSRWQSSVGALDESESRALPSVSGFFMSGPLEGSRDGAVSPPLEGGAR
jgi:hypothetical protein